MAEYVERAAVCNDCENLKICIDKSLCPVGRALAAEVVEVRPELRKAVKLLHKVYEKAKQAPFVRDPLAYALYRTWKAMDRRDDHD